MITDLRIFLDRKAEEYDQPFFIKDDPVAVPHLFQKKQDIEIAGFFAATFAWGNRKTIIKKSVELMQLMDMSPHAFCLDPGTRGLQSLMQFKHRTFNTTDLLYFVNFLGHHYARSSSLEDAFTQKMTKKDENIEKGLVGFYQYFFSGDEVPPRTRKHIANPARGSSCKRLNMFLRWMVRKDKQGVDFGIWKKISPSQLVCPIDLHVARVAKKLKLMTRKQPDWKAALELTARLKEFDKDDPVKYDFALFGLGILEKF
ncbi:MAG TPA: TIGR02757 family protein [Chitinophagaceae bacterium]|nr:TIGR02757 family protein [Chitinophagaceae bacterium]